jgi:hypothetical protein
MIKTTPEQNKTLVLQAFDTLFNKRDHKAAERPSGTGHRTKEGFHCSTVNPAFACIDFWSELQTGALVWRNLASFGSLTSVREFMGDT